MAFRTYLIKGWQQPNIVSYLLWPLSLLYRGIMQLRWWAYRLNVFTHYRAPVPVIVVGNISVGGTGKTPIVVYLVEQLRQQGFQPGVISRGYGGNAQVYPLMVKATTPAAECGDEPALITQRTQVPMVVGPNRRASIELLLSKASCDVIISDDGLQHYALARDVELCIIDATSPFKNPFLLPAGPWRESRQRLSRVNFVVEHHTQAPNTSGWAMWLNAQPPLKVSDQTVFESANFNKHLTKVHAVAGIGNPQRFFNTCRGLGFELIEHSFADHHAYQASDLAFSDDLPVLMTEKDAVKCKAFAVNKNWYYVPVEAQLTEGFIKLVISKLNKKEQRF